MNIKMIVIQNRIMTIILMALTLMWLSPTGSFDPKHPGFWMSIVCAIFIEVVTGRLLKWGQARFKKNKEEESKSLS